ncbi:MAG: hypothetical protein K9L68_09765 [Spirochaetales bacterium]|nr:hypothetical protein [Spirochaetales bacterium]
MIRRIALLSMITVAFLYFGCATEPEDSAVAEEPPPSETPEEREQTPETAPEEAEEAEEVEKDDPEDFEISEEVYTETFSDVENVIRELSSIIRKENFNAWKEYLTKEYIEEYSDPQTLRELSEYPLFKKNNIKLDSLRDYFQYVVVPSRSSARLDDLEFIGKEKVKAIMIEDEQRIVLFYLEKTQTGWKIGTSESPDSSG